MTSDWTLPARSGYVNGVVFVIIDLLALWAVQRGLMALQGFMIWRAIRAGNQVRLKRSSVPLLSGELLVRQTPGPNWFVTIHTGFLVLAFAASFGINGEVIESTINVKRAYTTFLLPNRTDASLRGAHTQRAFLRCRTTEGTDVVFRRAAFNMSGGVMLADVNSFRDLNGRQHSVDVESVVCINDDPLLFIQNCDRCFASLDEISSNITVQRRRIQAVNGSDMVETSIASPQPVPGEPVLRLLRREIKSAIGGVAESGDELYCVEVQRRPLRFTADCSRCSAYGTSDVDIGFDSRTEFRCVLARWSSNNTQVNAWYGLMRSPLNPGNDISLNLSIVSGSATISFSNRETMQSVFEVGLLLVGPLRGHSLLDVIDIGVLLHCGAKPGENALKVVDRQVTVIPLYSWLCMTLLVVFGILLGGVREILVYVLKKKGLYSPALLDANRYDVLSSILRDSGATVNAQNLSGQRATLCCDSTVAENCTVVELPEHWINSQPRIVRESSNLSIHSE